MIDTTENAKQWLNALRVDRNDLRNLEEKYVELTQEITALNNTIGDTENPPYKVTISHTLLAGNLDLTDKVAVKSIMDALVDWRDHLKVQLDALIETPLKGYK